MTSLPKILNQLVEACQSNGLEGVFDSSRVLGLLIERHRQNRYDDSSYSALLGSEELYGLQLSDEMVDDLVQKLLDILENCEDRASLMVWPLGKAYDSSVMERLLQFLEGRWEGNDSLTHGIIAAVYDPKLLENHWPLIEKIAKHGGPESRYMAKQYLENKLNSQMKR